MIPTMNVGTLAHPPDVLPPSSIEGLPRAIRLDARGCRRVGVATASTRDPRGRATRRRYTASPLDGFDYASNLGAAVHRLGMCSCLWASPICQAAPAQRLEVLRAHGHHRRDDSSPGKKELAAATPYWKQQVAIYRRRCSPFHWCAAMLSPQLWAPATVFIPRAATPGIGHPWRNFNQC